MNVHPTFDRSAIAHETGLICYKLKKVSVAKEVGGYRLYSVGVNLEDDDGITKMDTYKTDDIAIRTPDEDRRIKALVQKQRSGN